MRPLRRPSPAAVSLIDPHAERALLGLLVREPRRFSDPRITPALFLAPPHPAVFAALRTAAAAGNLAGDAMTATDVLRSRGITEAALLVAEAMLEAEDLVAEPLIRHVVQLASRRTTRALADALAGIAEHPAPLAADDREALTTIGARVTGLAEPPAAETPWVRVADVRAQRVAWLWERRIPFGKVTILEGDPGLGKSTLTLEIASRLTRGSPQEGDRSSWEPAGVVLCSAEDDVADTLRPRLEAAGADLSRVLAFKLEHLPTLPAELPTLRAALRTVAAALVVIDPLVAFLDAAIDSYRDQDVRRVLRELAALAAETGAAILIVRHLTKQMGSKALYRGGGSMGIGGAARSVLLLGADPEQPDTGRILAQVKNNLSPTAPALLFELEAIGETVGITWRGATRHRADDLVQPPEDGLEEAVRLLTSLLGPGPLPAADIDRERRAANITVRTWNAARQRLRIRSERQGFGPGGKYVWHLPTPEDLFGTAQHQRH
jgi:hypothetical protein